MGQRASYKCLHAMACNVVASFESRYNELRALSLREIEEIAQNGGLSYTRASSGPSLTQFQGTVCLL